MGKTIVLNLSDVKLQGNILDIGESFGVIYNISKEVMNEVSVDYVYAEENNNLIKKEYNICTMFFCLSRFWNASTRLKLIEEVSKYIESGGELFIWDINKEIKDMVNNKIITILPSGKLREFEFKNLNPLIKSNIEENKKLLEKYYKIEETKLWEDIHFIRASKI
ncbi:hypothetical protein H9660_01290 [Clostridium sp. Sa3CUN1]|uniref:Class I SAM-dependent methyltransferase n=1 Tax=Clostridium gallinarum TaxID=2762246 RepID=A0ABR8Q038_9CLOT|nr:hypothetical protein [Clostridium gallinarum]MBD7913774.1 hypothetical protein [Clostridium gallinarum]